MGKPMRYYKSKGGVLFKTNNRTWWYYYDIARRKWYMCGKPFGVKTFERISKEEMVLELL